MWWPLKTQEEQRSAGLERQHSAEEVDVFTGATTGHNPVLTLLRRRKKCDAAKQISHSRCGLRRCDVQLDFCGGARQVSENYKD